MAATDCSSAHSNVSFKTGNSGPIEVSEVTFGSTESEATPLHPQASVASSSTPGRSLVNFAIFNPAACKRSFETTVSEPNKTENSPAALQSPFVVVSLWGNALYPAADFPPGILAK